MGRSSGRLKGDWDKAGKLLMLDINKFEQEAIEELEECAEEYKRIIMEMMVSGIPEWNPLNPQWVARKGNNIFFLEKGELFEGIEIRRVRGSFRGQKIYVGASPYKTHRKGFTMDDFAGIVQGRYDRPLFDPAWERIQAEVESRMTRVGAKIIKY